MGRLPNGGYDGAADTDAEIIADLAVRGQEPIELKDENGDLRGLAAIGPDGKFYSLSFDNYLERPRAQTGTVQMHEPEALQAYIKAFQTPETALFADVETRTITAIFDGHIPVNGDMIGAGDAGFGRHRAVLAARITPQWKLWRGRDERWMSQSDFASHVQEGLTEIVDPEAAQMMEIAQKFRATKNANFEADYILHTSSASVAYTQTVRGKAQTTNGVIDFPTAMKLTTPVYRGVPPRNIIANLFFDIDGGLQMRYKLVNPDLAEEQTFSDLLDLVVEPLADVQIYKGSAPSAL